eukprot:Nk52_evm28s1360 gene=Nk52_evmTU28s1360
MDPTKHTNTMGNLLYKLCNRKWKPRYFLLRSSPSARSHCVNYYRTPATALKITNPLENCIGLLYYFTDESEMDLRGIIDIRNLVNLKIHHIFEHPKKKSLNREWVIQLETPQKDFFLKCPTMESAQKWVLEIVESWNVGKNESDRRIKKTQRILLTSNLNLDDNSIYTIEMLRIIPYIPRKYKSMLDHVRKQPPPSIQVAVFDDEGQLIYDMLDEYTFFVSETFEKPTEKDVDILYNSIISPGGIKSRSGLSSKLQYEAEVREKELKMADSFECDEIAHAQDQNRLTVGLNPLSKPSGHSPMEAEAQQWGVSKSLPLPENPKSASKSKTPSRLTRMFSKKKLQ